MATNSVRNLFKLYVGNLPWTVSHNQLKQYFSKFGHINQAVVVFDRNTGLSKNYGFVFFSNREAFEGALNKTNHQLEGNKILVQPANGVTTNTN